MDSTAIIIGSFDAKFTCLIVNSITRLTLLMRKNQNYARLKTFLISLPFVYFGQVYPYLHFHHNHDEYGSKVVVSAHPVSQERVESTGHESAAHRGEVPKHLSGDWVYTQASSRKSILATSVFHKSNAMIASSKLDTQALVQIVDHICPQQPQYIPLDMPRGPPLIV